MLATPLHDRTESGADLYALDRVDAHHRRGDVGVQPPVHGLAPAHRHFLRDYVHASAARIAGLAQLVHLLFELRHDAGVRREKRVLVDDIPGLERDRRAAELREIAAHHGAVFFLQPFLGDRAGRDADHRLASRRAPAAARIADAVLLQIGVVGVARAEFLRDRRVILRALVFVADEKADRGAGRLAFVHAGKNLYGVRLAALRDMARGPRLAAIELPLQVGGRERHSRRTAVDDPAVGGPVRFAE